MSHPPSPPTHSISIAPELHHKKAKSAERRSYPLEVKARYLTLFFSPENHKNQRDFALEHNIPRQTFHRWVLQSQEIFAACPQFSRKVKHLKRSQFPKLDEPLYLWFQDLRIRAPHIPIPFKIIHSQALRLFEECYPDYSRKSTNHRTSSTEQNSDTTECSNQSSSLTYSSTSEETSQRSSVFTSSSPVSSYSSDSSTYSSDLSESTTHSYSSCTPNSNHSRHRKLTRSPKFTKRNKEVNLKVKFSLEQKQNTSSDIQKQDNNNHSKTEKKDSSGEHDEDLNPGSYFAKTVSRKWTIDAPQKLCGIRNSGCVCWMISIIQLLFMHVQFRQTILHWRILYPEFITNFIHEDIVLTPIEKEALDKNLWFAFFSLFMKLELQNGSTIPFRTFTNAYSNSFPDEQPIKKHGDAAEFLRLLFHSWNDAFNHELKRFPNITTKFFAHTTTTLTVCPENHVSVARNQSLTVPVFIENSPTLLHALQQQCKCTEVEYVCENCKDNVKAMQINRLDSLPNTMIFVLQRFKQPNVDGTLQSKIDRHWLSFPITEYLDMNPYVYKEFKKPNVYEYLKTPEEITLESSTDSSSDSSVEVRKQLRTPQDFANLLGIKPSLKDRKPVRSTKHKKGKKKKKLNRESQNKHFQDYAANMYSLTGIVCHKGTLESGHYFSIIKERSTKVWYCFNDHLVEAIHPNAIPYISFGERTTCPPDIIRKLLPSQKKLLSSTAYILMYERVTPTSNWTEPYQSTNNTFMQRYNMHPRLSPDPTRNDEFTFYSSVLRLFKAALVARLPLHSSHNHHRHHSYHSHSSLSSIDTQFIPTAHSSSTNL